MKHAITTTISEYKKLKKIISNNNLDLVIAGSTKKVGRIVYVDLIGDLEDYNKLQRLMAGEIAESLPLLKFEKKSAVQPKNTLTPEQEKKILILAFYRVVGLRFMNGAFFGAVYLSVRLMTNTLITLLPIILSMLIGFFFNTHWFTEDEKQISKKYSHFNF